MSWWMWVLIVSGGLIALLVIYFVVESLTYPFRKRRQTENMVREHRRKLEKMTPAEREEEERQNADRRREMARMQVLSGAPTARMMGLADLVGYGDIEGLRRSFSLADSWETREMVVVAFMNLVRDKPDTVTGERTTLLNALDDILALSKAEASGGTFRQNCIDQTQSLANRVRDHA